ncbi:MAG: histidine kinase [Bacteroidota bacterium]
MKSRYLHPLGWLAFFLFQISEDVVYDSLDWLAIRLTFSYVTAMIICFYFFYPLVWRKVIGEKKYAWLIIFLPIGIGLFIGTRFLIEEVLYRWLVGQGNYRDPYQVGYIIDNTFRPISTILLSLVAWLLRRQGELKENRAILEKEKINAELGFLRSQINPHFLFNTLGFIQSRLFKADPEAASITTELSNVLRKAFDAGDKQNTTVAEELELIRSLHEIMKKRFDGKCYLDFQVDDAVLRKKIEPLLLMPLAENMFKHGDLRSADNPGNLSIKLHASSLIIRIDNPIMPGTPHEGSGIGLTNTRKRLDLAYPSSHSMEVYEESGRFVVDLILQNI